MSTPLRPDPQAREPGCVQCERLATELAVGALCGRERADALLHLQRCARCQDAVSELAVTAGRLLDLVPEAAPSPDLQTRVLASITTIAGHPASVRPATEDAGDTWITGTETTGTETTRTETTRTGAERSPAPLRIRRGMLGIGLAAASWAALVTGDVPATPAASTAPGTDPAGVVTWPAVQPAADVIAAPLISEEPDATLGPRRADPPDTGAPTGREVGRAWIHSAAPAWVYVSMSDTLADAGGGTGPPAAHSPASAPHGLEQGGDEAATCTIVSPSGASIDLGTFTLHNGHADWATPTTIDPRTLSQVDLVIRHGRTLARATFAPVRPAETDGEGARRRDRDGDAAEDESKAREKLRVDEQQDGGSRPSDSRTPAPDEPRGTDKPPPKIDTTQLGKRLGHPPARHDHAGRHHHS